MEKDIVVVGSGAAGLTAALVGARAGCSVLLLESTETIGGATALSGGAVWVPGHPALGSAAAHDSAAARNYLAAMMGNRFDDALTDAFLRAAPDMLREMENSGVRFLPVPVPDYAPSLPGAAAHRTLMPAPFDGTRLGRHLSLLRRPIPEMGLFGAMQIPHVDIPVLRGALASPGAAARALRLVCAYGIQRLRHGRGTRLGNGNALVASLLRSALDDNVDIRTNAPAFSLLQRDDSVVGLVHGDGAGNRVETFARAVVLATGGCGANAELRRRYVPFADHGWSLQAEGCRGDGMRMARELGAAAVDDNHANGIWAPISSARRRDGTLAAMPSLMLDRHCPGSLMVDAATGRRFFNESDSYQQFGMEAIARGLNAVFIISDARAVARYGLGMVKPRPFSPRKWLRNGYVVRAATIAELGRKIGIAPEILEETVSRFNAGAARGEDPDFARGADPYSRFNGDYTHGPNPALGPLTEPPFYALEVRPGDLSVVAGLRTNANAQVLNGDGQAITGLYAAGLDNNSLFRGHYPGGGASIGPAMTFAYIAARHAARAISSR